MKNELYFISSIFHLLVAAMTSASRPETRAFFVFIRFDKQRYEALIPCCATLLGRCDQLLFVDDGKSSTRQRKRNAAHILAFAKTQQVSRIFVGNDRHIEFQYVAHHLKKHIEMTAVYLDEGLYTYVGRKSSQSFAEKWVDQGLKKLIYGYWWQTPPTIGASKFIDEAWLAYPDQACSMLQSKSVKQLPVKGAETQAFKVFIDCWAQRYVLPKMLDSVDYVLTITDEKNFARFPNYRESVSNLVRTLLKQDNKVAVKYHPNADGRDLLNLENMSGKIIVLPSELPFEVLLPLLSKAILIAEFSSTLLTARLLMPQMTVWSIQHAEQNVPSQLQVLLEKLDIGQYSLGDIVKLVELN